MILLKNIDVTSIVQERISIISGKKRKFSIMKINLESEIDQDISLSDLLNVVNEIAFAKNIVLIMSTNHSEKLDDALIKDDRVDLKIEFTLSRKKELRCFFI